MIDPPQGTDTTLVIQCSTMLTTRSTALMGAEGTRTNRLCAAELARKKARRASIGTIGQT